jgi:hypothetical protein
MDMNVEHLFGMLEYHDLLSKEGVRESTVKSLPKEKLFELAEAIVQVTQSDKRETSKTIFAHSASLSLGGGREGCSQLKCRSSRVNELARVALMYSDKVYIDNFFTEYEHIRNHLGKPGHIPNEAKVRQRFFEDLYVLFQIRPLIEEGLIVLFSPPRHMCAHNLANISFGADANKRLQKEEKRLTKEYLSKSSATIETWHDEYLVFCRGPEQYFEHGGQGKLYYDLPTPISSMPTILKKLNKGEEVPLSYNVFKRLKIHKAFARDVVRNIGYDLATAQLMNTSFLTHKLLHISFLQSISDNPDIERRNTIALKHLTSFVPFVEDVNISNLIELRKREQEAFILYRQALGKAIDEFKSNKESFKTRDAQALYSDVIAPRLTTLEQRIQYAKRDLVVQPARSIAAFVGVISFGVYAGFIPTDIEKLAAFVGLKTIYDISKELLSLRDAKKNIRNEDMYFLWQVKQQSKKFKK